MLKVVLSALLFVIVTLVYFGTNELSLRSISSVGDANPQEKFFIQEDILHLNLKNQDRSFYISDSGAKKILIIENNLASDEANMAFTCDKNFQYARSRYNSNISQRLFADDDLNNIKFKLSPAKNVRLLLSNDIESCLLSVTQINSQTHQTIKTYKINISKVTKPFPWLAEFASYHDNCSESIYADHEPLKNFYFNKAKYSQLTCPAVINNFENLETPESGFLAKVEMLLGQKLSSEFIKNQNPYANLDFSKAPRLKAIFIATLVYRRDFYGTVIARLLKYHASRGTIVHLLTTKYMMLEKDKELLFGLANEEPNFRLQEFLYNDPNYDITRPLRYIDNEYRNMHIKLFITLSENEKDNAIVFGGRNIHDGFLFADRPDYSSRPELVQYGTDKDEDFVHWTDFEMKLQSKDLAFTVAKHLYNFFNRDVLSQKLKPFTLDTKQSQKLDSDQLVRHFISLPYVDQLALEEFYVSLIDRSEHKILLSSPYLRPTAKILSALERAAARHVDITIQTRVSLQGDTQAWLYEEVNKESINALYKKVKIFEWTENSILHSKFILIDDKLAFIGSVNLSRRSFVQDAENGFLFYHPALVQKMTSLFQNYLEKSRQVRAEYDRKLIPTLLIKLLPDQF